MPCNPVGNDDAILYLKQTVDEVGKNEASLRFKLSIFQTSAIYEGIVIDLTSIAIRRILTVKVNREKAVKQEEMRGVLHQTLVQDQYKGNRKRQENTKFREKIPNRFLDAMSLD